MDGSRVLELDIPSRPEYIAIVRLVVASVASARRALADERIDDLKLAVSEACTNAIEHAALECRSHDDIEIRCQVEPDGLIVEVVDTGQGFCIEDPPPPCDEHLHHG